MKKENFFAFLITEFDIILFKLAMSYDSQLLRLKYQKVDL
jgi:hypothetical protein